MKLQAKLIITFVSLNVFTSVLLIVVISYLYTSNVEDELNRSQQLESELKTQQLQAALIDTYTRINLISIIPAIDKFTNIDISNVSENEKERIKHDIQKFFVRLETIDPFIVQAQIA